MRRAMMLGAALVGSIAAAPLDRFDRVAGALRDGVAAEARGDRQRLAGAAAVLDSLGATPEAGSEDLAARWRGAGGDAVAPYRERALGPSYRRFGLPHMMATRFEQVFLAGRRARVTLLGIGGARARLMVRDDDDKPVCAERPDTACDWIPLWTTRYRIDIVNTGGAAGDFIIVLQ